MEAFVAEIVAKYNYWIYVVLMMIGFYAMIGKRNLVKKLLGMNIFQTAIILFFVSTGVKKGGSIPIVDKYQALAGGMQVTALVRNPARLTIEHPQLRVLQGDVLDAASVAAAMQGQQAVLSALGHKRFFRPTRILSEGTRNLLCAMEDQGVRRLVCETSMGIGDAHEEKNKLEAAQQQLTLITGQKPVVTKARKSVSNFHLREGMPVGLKVEWV